jgi:hypothetical protein
MMTERLLRAMAEELKLPLLQIARQAELAQTTPDATVLEGIEASATQALWFVDSYLLSRQLAEQATLELQPVAVSAALHDAAQQLAGLARQHGCTLELKLSGRYEPVMAHPQALQAALLGLGSSLIAAGEPGRKHRVVFAAHRGRGGVVAGVFSEAEGLSQTVFRRGKALYGQASQPVADFSAQGGAGIFLADSLFASMESQLRVAHHHKLSGLAATLQTSKQLALI